MPRAPTLDKVLDQLIVLIYRDPLISEEDLKLIIPKLKDIIVLISAAHAKN